MTKHYAYYGEVDLRSRDVSQIKTLMFEELFQDGEEIAATPSIVCDICGAECWEESYLTKVHVPTFKNICFKVKILGEGFHGSMVRGRL